MNQRPEPLPGLVVVDKPGGMTSHDVVARCRRILGTRKVGHAGTLDPMATGVLVIGVGRATRLLGFIAGHDKDYDATIRLGSTTVTDDVEGEVVATADPALVAAVTDDVLAAAAAALTGDILQIPSSVSAIKIDGVRSYARVRAGEDVELAARPVRVEAFDILRRRDFDVDVRVTCSTGTYVRALARDLGAALGVGAHLTALRRTRVGGFGLDVARSLDDLAESPSVLAVEQAVAAAFPRREATTEEAVDLRFGRPLGTTGKSGPVGVFDPDTGAAIAVVEDRDGLARPLVVLTPA
jgi:tRNA pseudouridine55 synthase